MPLNFPNQSRYFDAERGAVRFWGYDGALEVSCSIDCEALQVLVPGMELTRGVPPQPLTRSGPESVALQIAPIPGHPKELSQSKPSPMTYNPNCASLGPHMLRQNSRPA
ncbi:MAG: DUF1488 family protein [Hyphomicrobiaceae bacterium TMED74]|nr:hypothetical protein [Filomicrobium sp.]RPG42176.1 MAG: DUF1488 family protein [Hyphomicrobiaceae bacterium TMED74]